VKLPLVAMFATFAIFSVASSFSNLFINVYIWKNQNDFVPVAWFQFNSFLFVFVGFLCGAMLIRKVGSRLNLLLSSLTALVLYFYLIIAEMSTPWEIGFAGMLNGVYIGLFYAGLNFYSLWFSTRSNLSIAVSLKYIITGTAQMITPPVAGWIIHTQGYDAAFTAALVVLGLQALFSIATPQVRIRSPFRRKDFFLPSTRSMRYVGVSAASFGFFYAFVHMSIGVFFYLFLKDEWVLGEWNALFALLSICTYLFVGKMLMRTKKEIFGTLGVLASTIVTLTLFVPTSASFIIFNAVVSVSLPMMWVPAYTKQFAVIQKQVENSNANPLSKMMGLLVFHEFSLTMGRAAFFLLMMVSFWAGDRMAVMITILCFMPACLLIFSRKGEV
jgi:YQGE family putative transporter